MVDISGQVIPAQGAATAIDTQVWDSSTRSIPPRNAVNRNSAANTTSKLRQRFLPGSRTTLASLDVMFMTGAMAALVLTLRARLGFDAESQAMSTIICMIISAVAFSFAAGCYRSDALVNASTAVMRLVVALGVSTIFLVPLIHFGLGLEYHSLAFRSASRTLTIVLLGVSAAMFAGMLSRLIFLAMARRHWFRRTILIIGTGSRARYLRDLFQRSDRRLTEIHFITEEYLGGSSEHLGVTLPDDAAGQLINPLSGVQSVEELEGQLHIDQVVVAVDDPTNLHFDHLLPWKANGIPVFDFNTFIERETGRVDLRWTESHWLLYSDGFHFGCLDRAAKRLLDIVTSSTLLLLTLPTMLFVAAAIVVEDFGPVFYRQERVSQGGRRFHILKFRTMRVDAEKNGAQWASENDPRITRVGRFLRRTRIDEVPQLVNVLLGEMSMVGPRPERPCFVEQLSDQIRLYHLRHCVKAGVTGWAQINYQYGASVEDAERKLEYDLFYLKHFSVLRDISIMLQTFRVLVFAQGSR
jgi:sugar transferase (PEP-CTERM system associated)